MRTLQVMEDGMRRREIGDYQLFSIASLVGVLDYAGIQHG